MHDVPKRAAWQPCKSRVGGVGGAVWLSCGGWLLVTVGCWMVLTLALHSLQWGGEGWGATILACANILHVGPTEAYGLLMPSLAPGNNVADKLERGGGGWGGLKIRERKVEIREGDRSGEWGKGKAGATGWEGAGDGGEDAGERERGEIRGCGGEREGKRWVKLWQYVEL